MTAENYRAALAPSTTRPTKADSNKAAEAASEDSNREDFKEVPDNQTFRNSKVISASKAKEVSIPIGVAAVLVAAEEAREREEMAAKGKIRENPATRGRAETILSSVCAETTTLHSSASMEKTAKRSTTS